MIYKRQRSIAANLAETSHLYTWIDISYSVCVCVCVCVSYSPKNGKGWQLLEVEGEVKSEACLEQGRDRLWGAKKTTEGPPKKQHADR